MKKIGLLGIAVLGNAVGSALMFQTHLGMSAWGASASNVSLFFHRTPGEAFILVSAVFYIIAIIIRRRFNLIEFILSALFLFAFSYLLDTIIFYLPDFSVLSFFIRVLINFGGLLVLLFSISLHLTVNIAVHPMDVYLKALQEEGFHNVTIGTYVAYASAFFVAILFGVLAGGIRDLGIGTVMTVVLGGSIMGLYNTYIFKRQP